MRRLLFHLHLYAGLTLGLLTVLAGLTGSLLVFRREIETALDPALLRVRPRGQRAPLQSVVDVVRKAYPQAAIQHLFLPRDASQVHEVWLKGDAPRVYVDPYTGAILGARPAQRTPTGFLFALHTELLGGERGEIVVLLGAGALVVMSVTGMVLWWPATGKLLRARLGVKWRSGWKRVNYDLHRALGFYAAGLLCLAAVTGASFVPPFQDWFAGAVARLTQSPPRPKPPKLAPVAGKNPLPLDALVQRAEPALPGGQLTRVGLPATPGAPVVVRKKFPGELHPNGMNFIHLDPYTGRVLLVENARTVPAGPRILNLRYPLHTGIWGGKPTRVLYVLLGLTPLVLFVSGCLMWRNRTWAKRRRTRRTRSRDPHPLPALRKSI